MPPISTGARILVTGANGFIAAQTCSTLTQRGHTVIGTVRSKSKGEYLKKVIGDKFDYVVVENIEKPDAFDNAVKSTNVDAVVHMASPVDTSSEDPAVVIGPAVSGTTGILKSALEHGPSVKRIVITSSVASLIVPKDGTYTFTESDWNTYSPSCVEQKGKNAGIHKYRASKVLAERAAWTFMEDNKDTVKFDLTTILPPLVFGPLIHQTTSLSKLNETSILFLKRVTNPPLQAHFPGVSGNLVDVRDVALAHALALESDKAGGERFIVSNGPFAWQQITDELYEAGITDIPIGVPGSWKAKPFEIIMDGSKASDVLGLKYRTIRETAVDGLNSLRERFGKEVKI
ncbi:NAD-binding protein [Cantharellus anzutake]|uniref:NAD-binding protein n=1 Tax=Cantharellus anzutake TaxID=1750568 RepID=UPI0019050D80|nr:NAD-binding protein [Cantharellus anzutake]KAF8335947.1 NAD-binding protein [Cantharellus anzutake]